MTNTPAVPRLMPLIVIRPRIYPNAAMAKTESIRKFAAFIVKDIFVFLVSLFPASALTG